MTRGLPDGAGRAASSDGARAGALFGLLLSGLLMLGGCGSLPQNVDRPFSLQRIAAADTILARMATDAGVPSGRSGFHPLTLSGVALQARLALIQHASTSIDLQTYLLGDDATGHQVLRALRDAAARGVRIRLLLDDLYTDGMTDLLLGLAAHENIELRLYNPFPGSREWAVSKLWSFVSDFRRLNRRMHNKLFIADGRVAVVGGRNLADDYFMRSSQLGNFLDFDLLCAGAVVPELGEHFDVFWNSEHAYPVQALADNGLDTEQRRRSFEVLTRPDDEVHRRPGMMPDATARARVAALWKGRIDLAVADAQVFFDSPDKTRGQRRAGSALRVVSLFSEARSKVIVVSPYFMPTEMGLERLQQARQRGVEIEVVTNSLLDSDEPLVSLAYGRHRHSLLRAGVRLFELSSALLKHQPQMRSALGTSQARLHAKLGFIDDRYLVVGSMNLDPRSATTNTELAMVIDNPALTQQVLEEIRVARSVGTYEVRLRPDGQSMEWVSRDEDQEQILTSEPRPGWLERLRLWLLTLLVPDDLL